MKNQILFYLILTFIFLPIAAVLGFFGLFALMGELANPAFLLGVFMLACIVIYTYTSFTFFSKAILRKTICKPSLRDWIKVNAYVSIAFAVLSLLKGFSYCSSAARQKQGLDQGLAMASQPPMPARFQRP